MRALVFGINWWLSLLASLLRLGAGGGRRPAVGNAVPVLYEFEACPFCRIAREAISEAGVAVKVRPCPKGGQRYRPMVKEMGGKAQFPYLVDGETGEGLYESSDIARRMRASSGAKRALVHWLGPLNLLTSQLGILLRLGRGMIARPGKVPVQLLEFHGSERDPAARLVKERLCEMELEYLWTPSAPVSKLVDPNTDEELVGAGPILQHLKAHYSN